MKTDTEVMRESLKKNRPDLIREGEEVVARVHCGCGYEGKAVFEVYDENAEQWFAYCKCEV